MDVAMENYFYDIDFTELINQAENSETIKSDLINIVEGNSWDDVLVHLDPKHMEKSFLAPLEKVYSELLKLLIEKSYGGNKWIIENCRCCSENEKLLMSFFIAIQLIRTKHFRETVSDTIEKTLQALINKGLIYNSVQGEEHSEIVVESNKDFVKLQHSQMMLDAETTINIAETLNDHIWVMYIIRDNDKVFYTSDNPIARIPHIKNQYISYSGLKSKGIEILFPVTPKMLLGMYDRETYEKAFSDRMFMAVESDEQIDYFNRALIAYSYRCLFSQTDDFSLAYKMCKEFPDLQERPNLVSVG